MRTNTLPTQKRHIATPRYRWANVTMSAPFAARDGAGVVSFNGRIWLVGGWNNADRSNFPKDCVNDVWSTQDGLNWRLERHNDFGTSAYDPICSWEGRHTAGTVVHQNMMWIVGGDAIQGHHQNDIWCSSDGVAWQAVHRDVPWGPRVLHHTVAFKDHLWIMGGQTLPQFASAQDMTYRDVWRSRNGRDWTQIQPVEPFWSARGMIGGTAIYDDRMWIIGGGVYETPSRPNRISHNDVWSSQDGVHWSCHTDSAPWQPRNYHEVAVFDNKLWILEGFDGQSNLNDVWWSQDGSDWHQLPDTPWAPRHAASVVVHDDALWVIAGNNMQSDVWKLTRE